MNTGKLLGPPWWAAVAWRFDPMAAVQRRAAGPGAARGHDRLVELDARSLRDIGAPDCLLARALARRESAGQERDALRLGIAAAAWRHW